MEGISFVVPVRNGAACIRDTIDAIFSQADGRPMEVIVVDDHSHDGSSELLRQLADVWSFRIVPGDGRGAAAAINTGIRAARFPIICQVDQDVVLRPDWMRLLVQELDDPHIAAAQGDYVSDPDAPLCARAMSLDLEQRYAAIDGCDTDQVCTGNAAYRADALHQVGLFDETLGYGYDNDLSYRLRAVGFRLTMCRTAQSVHRWREGLGGYLVQQYGFGYGRLDLVAKHPDRVGGDAVSPAGMMVHPLLMATAMAFLLAAPLGVVAVRRWRGDPCLGPRARAAGGRSERGSPVPRSRAIRFSRLAPGPRPRMGCRHGDVVGAAVCRRTGETLPQHAAKGRKRDRESFSSSIDRGKGLPTPFPSAAATCPLSDPRAQ